MAALFKEIWDALWENYEFIAPYLVPFRNAYYHLFKNVYPHLSPLLNTLAASAQAYPPVVVVGLFLIFILVALQVILYIQSVMSALMRWIRNGLIVGALVVVGSVIYKRGVERTWNELVGEFEFLKGIWLRYYKEHQKGTGAGMGMGTGTGAAANKTTVEQWMEWWMRS